MVEQNKFCQASVQVISFAAVFWDAIQHSQQRKRALRDIQKKPAGKETSV